MPACSTAISFVRSPPSADCLARSFGPSHRCPDQTNDYTTIDLRRDANAQHARHNVRDTREPSTRNYAAITKGESTIFRTKTRSRTLRNSRHRLSSIVDERRGRSRSAGATMAPSAAAEMIPRRNERELTVELFCAVSAHVALSRRSTGQSKGARREKCAYREYPRW